MLLYVFSDMATASLELSQPSGMTRAKHWSEEVENVYRFQLAGYKDEREYMVIQFIINITFFLHIN